MDGLGPEGDDYNPAGMMPAGHPLMERVQGALRNQLIKADERITLELRDRKNELGQLEDRREAVGVELYNFQQALAKVQIMMEKKHEELNKVVRLREHDEQEANKVGNQLKTALEARAIVLAKREKAQKELEKQKLMLRHIDETNKNLKDGIMVTRRAAYGTEESMQKLEVEKVRQDERISQLEETRKSLEAQVTLVNSQISAQKQETQLAIRAKQEASAELQLISVEKKEYLHKWKSAVNGMAQRDAALQATRDEISSVQDKLQSLNISILGFNHRTQDQRAENVKVEGLLARNDAMDRALDVKVEKLSLQRKELEEMYMRRRQELEMTDEQLREAKAEHKALQSSLDQMNKQHAKQVETHQRLDEEFMETLSEQTTIDKKAKSVYKQMILLKKEIHEKEAKMADIQNEIARIKVDALNTQAHNEELSQTLKAYEEELKNKDKLIEKYTVEIRQRHDKIDKKQVYVARLNKKIEQLVGNRTDEHTGPLEATVHNMSKEIGQVQKETAEKERDWIWRQKELMETMQIVEDERNQVKDITSKRTVLHQKQMRLRTQLENEMKDIAVLKNKVRNQHTAMRKINDLINNYCTQESKLGNVVYCSEGEFVSKLNQLELESVNLEGLAAKLKAEKEEFLSEIVEVEKQILLWEKKIQLEKETQAALDPEYGQPEIVGMKKEIHRMKLRLGILKRQQEQMIVDMEKAIGKRETIQTSNMHFLLSLNDGGSGSGGSGSGSSSSSGGNDKAMTQAGVQRAITQLRRVLENHVRETQLVEQEIVRKEQDNQVLLEELAKQQEVYSRTDDSYMTAKMALEDAYFTKQLNAERITVAQKKAKLFEDAATNRLRVGVSQERLTEELDKQQDMKGKIREALNKLSNNIYSQRQTFTRLMELVK